MVALVSLCDQFVDLAIGYLCQDPVAFADGDEDGIKNLVNSLVELSPSSGKLVCVASGIEFAFIGCRHQNVSLFQQIVCHIDQDVQVVLDLVEVAIVAIGDLRGYVSLRDAVHILGRNVQGVDHRVEGLVDSFNDLPVIALMLGGICASGELALDRRFDEEIGVGHEGV